MRKFLFMIVQLTWGLGATAIGLLFFIRHINCPHKFYHGAIQTTWKSRYAGLSLGLFIFTPDGEPDYSKKVRVHEYGHCIQSLVLGPLYALVGIISVNWGMNPIFVKIREKKNIPYTSCFVEKWASKWGELATGEEAAWM